MSKFIDRTGEKAMMNCGELATIIDYRNIDDIDVQFESGIIVRHRRYYKFAEGSVTPSESCPNKGKKNQRIGERVMTKYGVVGEIINYRSSRSCDIKFDNGHRVNRVEYRYFKSGSLRPYKNPSFWNVKEIVNHVGERKMQNCGWEAVIIKYEHSKNIDIAFPDGTILKKKIYEQFKKGRIRNPNGRVGEIETMNCGDEAEIIAWRSHLDIDVSFGKDCIKTATYSLFKNKNILRPGRIHTKSLMLQRSRVGEKRRMNCGEICEIIRYNNACDIDVKFESGEVRTKVTYGSFSSGQITPKSKASIIKERVGEARCMRNGLKAKIVKYRDEGDMDIVFEDGLMLTGVRYSHFTRGNVKHPYLRDGRSSEFKDFQLRGKEFTLSDGRVFYKAISPKGEPGIWTPQQMMEYCTK